MEKEYYTTDFEQLLKDATEDFKMYPSRRVWNSLYNNLHPAKRWPSLAVCLLLVTAILYIGVTNNNAINASSRFATTTKILKTESNPLASSKVGSNSQPIEGTNHTTVDKSKNLSYEQLLADQDRVSQLLSLNVKPDVGTLSTASIKSVSNQKENSSQSLSKSSSYLPAVNNVQNSINAVTSANVATIDNKPTIDNFSGVQQSQHPLTTTDAGIKELPTADKNIPLSSINESQNNTDKAWIDNYAFYNRRNKNKWKAKSSLQYYITPSVGFRDITDNSSYKPGINNSFVINPTNGNINKDVDQQAAINLEAGAAMIYGISKKLRLKAGLQFNYTNYTINAYELKHPAQTTLLLNDPNSNYYYLQQFNTLYANSPALSSKKLANKTVQLSIPLGFDYKIAGNNKIQWLAGASVQPTYVFTGNAYLLSSDMKFYVNENSFIKHWNMNTAVETFISYKTSSGIIINAGPQLRYQLFSTYNKQYTYTEKLYNIGLKMGITRNF